MISVESHINLLEQKLERLTHAVDRMKVVLKNTNDWEPSHKQVIHSVLCDHLVALLNEEGINN